MTIEGSDYEDTSSDEEILCYSSSLKNRHNGEGTNSSLCKSKIFHLVLFISIVLMGYILFEGLIPKEQSIFDQQQVTGVFNASRGLDLIGELCSNVRNGIYAGDLCDHLCSFSRNWSIINVYEGQFKYVIKFRENGKDFVVKIPREGYISRIPDTSIDKISHAEFMDKILSLVNNHSRLGWPDRYKSHLVSRILPGYDKNKPIVKSIRQTVWKLLQQFEYINLSLLPLSRVTPKIISICGYAYRPEYMIPFRMKPYYLSLKAKILVHLEGTLKLFDEFLNEPLQWCDVKFENLGLSAEYPKRFIVTDSSMIFTKNKLDSILTSTKCQSDDQCKFGDCEAKCLAHTGFCSQRINDNIEVFCRKLIGALFTNHRFLSKANTYLAACSEDATQNTTKRLNELRLAWGLSLSDI